MSRSNLTIHEGGIDAALAHYSENATPQLLIMEIGESADETLGQLDTLAEVCDAGTNVILIGQTNDILLYRELIKRGVAEYLVNPVAPRDIYEAVASIFIDPNAPPQGRTYAFIGSRGGSGSSTVAFNTAWYMAEQNPDEEITIVDLDVTFGTAALAFNFETQQTVDELMSDPERLDDVLIDRFMIDVTDNLKLLASPASLDADERQLSDGLDSLLDILRRRSNHVILDVPHRWAPWVQQVLLEADETVVVGSLDLSGLRDSKTLIDRLKRQRGEQAPVHLVLNHEGAFKKTELSAKDFENAIELEPTATIAHDPNLFGTATNNGQMIAQVNAKGPVQDTYLQLCLRLTGKLAAIQNKKKGFSLNFMRSDKTEAG